MSHNKITVGSQAPDATGEISVALGNLSNVDTSGAANGQVLSYNGTSFETSSAAVSLGIIFLAGKGSTANYPQTLSDADNVYFYAPSPVNTISGASLLDSDSIGNDWYDGVTLPAGSYIIDASLHGDYTGSTGLTSFIIKTGTVRLGCFGQDVDGANNSDYPSDASAYINLATSADIIVDMTSVTAANSTTTTAQSERGYFRVLKIG